MTSSSSEDVASNAASRIIGTLCRRREWDAHERQADQQHERHDEALEEADFDRAGNLRLAPHQDDVDGVANRRCQDGQAADQRFPAKVGARLAEENDDDPGERDQRGSDRCAG